MNLNTRDQFLERITQIPHLVLSQESDWTHQSACLMCETRDLGFKWPQWHTLMFSDEIKIGMRFVCPKSGTRKPKLQRRSGKWQRNIVVHPLGESQWNRGLFCMGKWESEKHKSWCVPTEGFKGHVATDGSLLVTAGKWCACGWAVVQLDCDEEMGPLHGMYGSMEAEYEVQRTIKRAESKAFLCLLRKVCGPIKVHVYNKGIIDVLRKGEKECIKPRAGDADL